MKRNDNAVGAVELQTLIKNITSRATVGGHSWTRGRTSEMTGGGALAVRQMVSSPRAKGLFKRLWRLTIYSMPAAIYLGMENGETV